MITMMEWEAQKNKIEHACILRHFWNRIMSGA